MGKFTFLIAFMLAFFSGYGQVSNYSFSQSTGTYTELTGGTVLASCTGCAEETHDTDSYVITLPTPVVFNGFEVTSVLMRTDGSLVMGTTETSTSTGPLSASTVASGVIAALGMNLENTTAAGQLFEMRWEEVGDSYIFQWKNAARSAQTTELLNFQIMLNKLSGVVSIMYGNMTVNASTTLQPHVGLRGLTSSDYNNRRLTTSIPDASPSWDDTVAGTSNSNTVRLTSGTTPAVPVSGLTYVWSPSGCFAPSPLSMSSVGGTTATGHFTPATGITNYEYYIATSSTAPTAGTAPSGTVPPGTTLSLSSLSPTTTYYVYLRSNCGGSSSAWTAVTSFVTTQIPGTIPFTEGFEGANNWNIVNGTQTNKWFISNFVNNGGSNSLYVSNNATGANNDYSNTTSTVHAYRDIAIPAGATDMVLSFDWRTVGEDTYDYVRIWAVPTTYIPTAGTQITVTNSGGVMIADNIQGSATFTTYSALLNAGAYAGQSVRLVFSWRNDGSDNFQPAAAIDNISLQPATCFVPSNLQAASIVGNSTISWTAPATLPANGYDIFISDVNTAPVEATTPTHTSTATTLAVNDLTTDTLYYYWVRSNCGSGDTSFWISGGSFRVDCPAATPPTAFESFTDYGTTLPVPGCWREAKGDLTTAPVSLTGVTSLWTGENFNNSSTSENGKAARVELYGTKNDWMISPAIDLGTGAIEYQLEYTASVIPWSGSATVTDMGEKYVKVVISTDGGQTWSDANVVRTYNNSNIPSAPVMEYISLAGYTGVVKIGFYAYSTTTTQDLRFYIDNYRVIETPACLNPLTPEVTAIGENSGTLNWVAPAVAPANGYQYYLSTLETAPTAATTATGSVGAGVLTANLASMAPGTDYYVWVRSNCGLSSYSEWVGPVSFITNCDSPNVLTTASTPVCGENSSTLTATVDGGTVRWYENAEGGIALATGGTYTTPLLTESATYYASAVTEGTTITNAARLAPESTAGTTPDEYGLVFDAYSAFTINTVDVYLRGSAPGTLEIALQDNTGATLETIFVDVPAGSTTAPVQHTINLGIDVPVGTGYRLMGIDGPSLVRESSAGGFPYALGSVGQITSGYLTSTTTTYYFFYNWSLTPMCASARVAVPVTVTPAPAIDATAAMATICDGQSTDLSVTSANAGYTYVWMPGNLTGATQTVSPAETTTYTVTATDAVSGCITTDEVTVTVNPLPSAIVIENATTCLNEVVTLTATGGNIISSGKIGSGTATNTLSTPFKGHWGGSKTQAIYTAAELTALGLAAGDPITSIGYVVLSGTPVPFNDFTINIGLTSETSITTFSSAATNQIFTAASYTATGVPGILTFNVPTPIVWDGVSNLLVETCFNNVNTGSGTVSNLSVESTTVASGLNIYLSQDNNPTVCTNTNTPTATTNRPNLVVGYAKQGAVSWSPATNLYTDATATTPYVAGATASVLYFKSSTEGISSYNVTSTLATGCSVSETIDVSVISTAAVTASDITLCNGSTVADLTPVATGDNLQWYDAATGGTALASTTLLTAGTYYVSQTQNGCESDRTSFVVTINTTAEPTVADLTYCNAAPTVADIIAATTGTDVKVYDALTGGTELAPATALVSGDYFVSQTLSGCESARAVVAVILNTTTAPTATDLVFCNAAPTVSEILATITGDNLQLYDLETGGTALEGTAAVSTATYYVSQTINGCESARDSFTITLNTTDAPAAPAAQTFCAGSTVANIEVTGTATQWYSTATGDTPVVLTTELTDGTVYYVSQTINSCESTRTAVTVTVITVVADDMEDVVTCGAYTLPALTNGNYFGGENGTGTAYAAGDVISSDMTIYIFNQTGECTAETSFTIDVTIVDAPTGEATQTVNEGTAPEATIEDLVVTATGTVTWYATEEDALAGTNPLAAGTEITTGDYFAVQTINGCTSAPFAVTVTVTLDRNDFAMANVKVYPNPVVDKLVITYSSDITFVEVYNLLGQRVIVEQPNATTATINMSNLETATYIVKVTADGMTKDVKVVKRN